MDDPNIDSRERAQFRGLYNKLTGRVFIMNLAIMCDALAELSSLSESLQCADISLPKAQQLILRKIEVFTNRTTYDGECFREATTAVESGFFQKVKVITEVGRQKEMNKSQFYQCLADSLSAKLFPETEKSLTTSISVLFTSSWPADISPEYGEVELKQVCKKFLVKYSATIKDKYRDFKDFRGE